MDGLANLQLRMNLWTQAVVLECLAFGVLACIAAFIGILQTDINIISYYSYTYYYIPGDSIWMLLVSILSILATGYFLITQPMAKLPEYQPVTVFFSMGVSLTAIWFTCAVSLASNSISGCIYYSQTAVNDLCVTGGLADALAWLSFAGFLMFTLTIYAVGKKAGSWSSWNQNNVQMGAVPVKGYPPNPQQPYSQQPYSQQPYSQQPYPQQPYPVSPTPQPQQLYSQQSIPLQPYPQQPFPQQPYPQQPYPASPTPHPQQLYSQQSFPTSPVQSLQQPFPVSPTPTSIQLPDKPIPEQHPPHSGASQSFDNSPALPDQIYHVHPHPPNEV